MARHHPQQPQPAHGHGSLRDATLDRFGLRVPIAVVEERLQASLPGATKAYTQGIFRIVVVFSILAGPMLWGSLGLRWALLAEACLWLLVPIAALTAKGTVRKNLEHWRRFPWQQGVSFINERQGLVLLSGEGFATEKPQAAWAPVMIEGVDYVRGEHALLIATWTPGAGRIAKSRFHTSIPLPREVVPGQGEAMADVFHMMWTLKQRAPSAAAKAWLEGR